MGPDATRKRGRKLIEWGSTFYTFYPGDVLYTGTPEGVSPVRAHKIGG